MKVLDLFSGIGGFSLGLERAGMETIAFCEIENYPKKVLAKHWPNIPIASDVTKLTYQDGVLYDDGQEIYRGSIDVICGGFPCQDISVAGKQAGIEEGTRSGLWSECARLLREVRPDYAIFENVTALLSGQQGRWFQRVLFDISEVGYDAEWHCISASELGAHHHRDRVWVIACADSVKQSIGIDESELKGGGKASPKRTKPFSGKRWQAGCGRLPAAHEARLGWQDRESKKKGVQVSSIDLRNEIRRDEKAERNGLVGN